MAKTLQDIIDGKATLTTDEKKSLKEAMGIDDTKGKGGVDKSDAKQREAYNKVLKETAVLLGNAAAAAEAEREQLAASFAQRIDNAEELAATMQMIRDDEADGIITSGLITAEEAKRFRTLESIHRGQKKYGTEQKKLLGDIASGIGLGSRMEDTFLGNVISVTNALKAQGQEGEDARNAFAANLKSIFNWQTVALSVFSAIAEMTMKLVVEFDNARAKLASMTGAGYEFSDAMFEAQRQTNLYGVSMDQAADATGALVAQTANFAKLSAAARVDLIVVTAQMEKLGIDSATASANFDFFNNNLGMTQAQATKAGKSLAMLGNEIGISSEKIMKDFQASLPTLSVYGEKSVKVFTNLAAAAKAANVETSALLGIAKKFDTFSGAADGAAKLNALLGTQLSTTQMLMMTEDERIETLVDSVQAQGVAFGDMDKYTQLAIAHAAGIEDMNEANKIFGMSSVEYEKNKEVMNKNAEAQAKFEAAVTKTVPIMTAFKLLATELVVAVEPILETLSVGITWVTDALKGMSTTQKAFAVGIPFVVAGVALMAYAIYSVVGAFSALTVGAPAAGASIAASIATITTAVVTSMGAITTAVGVTGGIAGAVLAGMVVSLVAVTGAIAAVAIGAGKMFDAFARMREAKLGMMSASQELASNSEGILKSLGAIATADFTAALTSMKELVATANQLGSLDPKASAAIENLALLSVGKAKDSMTNKVIQASTTNIQANVKNVFRDMKMVVKIGEKEFEGYVSDIAADTALGLP